MATPPFLRVPSLRGGRIRSRRRSSSSNSSTDSQPKRRRVVSFDKVIHVREYERALGNHGILALGLGWNHTETKQINLNHHEQQRLRRKPRIMRKLSTFERKNILMILGGYTEETLHQAHLQHQKEKQNTTAFGSMTAKRHSIPSAAA